MMTGIDFRTTSLHYNRGVTMDKMNVREKQNDHLADLLPSHMHKPTGRLSLGATTYTSLEANHCKGSG